jgi:hypothetical protein
MRYLGNISVGQAISFLFSTNDGGGAAAAPTTPGTVSVYKDDNTSQTTTGVTYAPSFDNVVGVNLVSIDTSDVFYAAGHDYTVVLCGAVIDGETVNAVLAMFSIDHRQATAALTDDEHHAVADAILDRANAVETGKTVRQAMRIMAAVLAGKVSGAGSGVENFTGVDGVTPRVEVTTDAAGNRTTVNYSA